MTDFVQLFAGGCPLPRQRLAPLYFAGSARTTCETVVFAYLPIALYQQTGASGLVMIALMTAIPAVVRFFAAQLWGTAIDRRGRQKPFLLTGLGTHVVLLALLALNDRPEMTVPLIALGATLYSAFSPAARTMATLIDEARAAERGVARKTLPAYLKWESTGWLIGGIASGFLLDYFPVTMKHLLAGASLVGALAWAAMALWLKDAPVKGGDSPRVSQAPQEPAAARINEREQRSWQRLWQSLSVLYARPEFSGLLLILFFTFFAREAFFTTYGIYLTESLQGGTTLYGASIGIATLLGIFLYDAASKLATRWGSIRLVRATASVYVLGYAITVAFPHPWVLAGYFSLPLFPFLTMAAAMAITEMSAAQERGRGLGILEATDLLAIAVGSVSAGLIATRWGLAAVPVASLGVGSLGIAASFLLGFLWGTSPSRRQDPAHEP